MNSYLFAYNLAVKYSLFPCLGESANLGEKQMARKGGRKRERRGALWKNGILGTGKRKQK